MAHAQIKNLVLLVEDNEFEIKIVQSILSQDCEIIAVKTIQSAQEALQNHVFALILLDVGLPDGCGYKLCEYIRSSSKAQHTPIIFLTGRGSVEERVSGFTLGADDYIVKPIEPREFIARVRAKLKRPPGSQVAKSFTEGDFFVDVVRQQVSILRSQSKELLNLTPLESKLIIHFLQNEGTVFSRQDLVKAIWGESTHVSSHTVDSHISSLRKKMGDFAQHLTSVQKKAIAIKAKN